MYTKGAAAGFKSQSKLSTLSFSTYTVVERNKKLSSGSVSSPNSKKVFFPLTFCLLCHQTDMTPISSPITVALVLGHERAVVKQDVKRSKTFFLHLSNF